MSFVRRGLLVFVLALCASPAWANDPELSPHDYFTGFVNLVSDAQFKDVPGLNVTRYAPKNSAVAKRWPDVNVTLTLPKDGILNFNVGYVSHESHEGGLFEPFTVETSLFVPHADKTGARVLSSSDITPAAEVFFASGGKGVLFREVYHALEPKLQRRHAGTLVEHTGGRLMAHSTRWCNSEKGIAAWDSLAKAFQGRETKIIHEKAKPLVRQLIHHSRLPETRAALRFMLHSGSSYGHYLVHAKTYEKH